jgi:signal transduction histidine kinase
MEKGNIIRRTIDERQLWLLFTNLPLGLLGTLVSAVVVAIIFSDAIEQSRLEGWLLTMMTVVALRYILYLYFKSKIKSEKQYRKWEILFSIGLFATALVWAASVSLFFTKASLSDQLLLSFVLGGMVSGAMSVAAYRFYLYALYNVPILGVLMIYVFISGNYYFGGMVVLYMMITLVNAKRMADDSAKVQILQMNNDRLIERLMKEKNSVKEALEEATNANSMKDLFIGNISHEFRTPLNAIQGFSQVLQYQPDVPDSTVTILKKINASGNKLLALVDVLMQYSKYKSGNLEYVPTKGMVQEVVSSLVSQERVRVLEKQLTFEVDIPSNTIIEADFVMLKSVLNIVIEDAIENAPKESRVMITAFLQSENDSFVMKICNTGPALKSEDTKELFDPFVQMQGNHENRNLARGLGFYIAKGMIEDFHQGSCRLFNTQTEGYCVELSIPNKENK